MIKLPQNEEIDYDLINIDEDWNDSNEEELTMHTIHAYPAKFPAFIASKAFEYAVSEGVNIKTVADIFCGCGTVALEAKIHNYNFWGCDINPVATLIARTKSNNYDIDQLNEYYMKILKRLDNIEEVPSDTYSNANERLKYWFTEESYCELLKIYLAINEVIQDVKYKEAFECIFSSILKAASKWLTKSIKPQIDPNKKEIDILKYFQIQHKKFLKAVKEIGKRDTNTIINCHNFLTIKTMPKVDLVITSPPYVTSYEYADLHQLSSLWLGFTDDYRDLRKGSIGSAYNSDDFMLDLKKLNSTGRKIVKDLLGRNKPTAKVKSVARYYADMQRAIERCTSMLQNKGMAFFVVGDTEYKGVKIQNSKHLVEAMIENGFRDIKIGKRTISKRICIPYRDKNGKFSKDKSMRKVYHEEFIISGRIYL